MEQGELHIFKSKKGKWIVELLFKTNGKKKRIPIRGGIVGDDSLNGKEVGFEREKGQVESLICEGKELIPKKKVSVGATNRHNNPGHSGTSKSSVSESAKHIENVKNPAKAPYNFVPLNDMVVESDSPPPFPFDTYHKGRYTGFIDLEIEAKTPVYIRDTMSAKDMERDAKDRDDKDNPDFFSPGGRIRIPGSSIRGMIRTLVEVVSFGKFGSFNDKKLYFRAVADMSSLNDAYKKVMVDEKNNHFPKIRAGLLEKRGPNSYRIYPSAVHEKTQIYRVNFNKNTKIVAGTDKLAIPEFDFKKIYFKAVEPKNHIHFTPRNKKISLKYALLKSISTKKDKHHPDTGYIVSSGGFGKKKHMHWVINNQSEGNSFNIISNDVVENYRDDQNRNKKADLLEKLKEVDGKIPCFYVTNDSGDILSFGHTGMFRLAYEKSIGEHIPQSLKEERKVDIAEAIFGNESKFAGRVFFEDAFLSEGQNNVLMAEAVPMILASPKPTTFQHYLNQPKNDIKKLHHYNSKGDIRGNKFYWHKSGQNWQQKNEKEIRDHHKQYTSIKPVKPETRFKGRIRFDNLSQIELGALLFSLELPEGCLHKIGMGKPLGLGSTKIKPVLYLSNRKERYEKLFFEWNNEIEASRESAGFKSSFEKYVLAGIKEPETLRLWDTPRLAELKTMLDYKKGMLLNTQKNTEYMGLPEFRTRRILPKPTSV